MKMQESAENYLESILVLSKAQENVRSIDIANELKFSKASVSIAMKRLRENGYIEVGADGHIILTDTGKEIAGKMYERHSILSNWLVSIGVDKKTAAEDACRIEHVLSEETFDKIRTAMKY